MCPNLESHSTIKRSPSTDNRLVSSNGGLAAGDIIIGKKEQRAAPKAPRRAIGIFSRQHSPRGEHKQRAMETAKISDSSVSAYEWILCRSQKLFCSS